MNRPNPPRPSPHLPIVAALLLFAGCGGDPPARPHDLAEPPAPVGPAPPGPLKSGSQLGRLFINTTDGAHVLSTENGVLKADSAKFGRIIRCLFYQTTVGQFSCLPSDAITVTTASATFSDPGCQTLAFQAARGCTAAPIYGFVNAGTPCAPSFKAYGLQAATLPALYSLATGNCQMTGAPIPGFDTFIGQPVDMDRFPHGPYAFE